nr:hypothetical protein [Tanacetum cinerariifolium]
MLVYWASVFLLSKNVIYEINKLLKGFLWRQGELTKGKAKISWDSICKPKEQGGLEIKDLQVWNEVLLIKQLWNVVSRKNTMWVKWVNSEKLKRKIGDGKTVNAWYDNWNSIGPLCEIVTTREISIDTTVADLVDIESGNWPDGWVNEYPILSQYKTPSLQEGMTDDIVWVDNDGKGSFLVSSVYGRIYVVIQQRIFKEEKRDEKTMVQLIKEVIRLKIAGFEVKESKSVRELEGKWNVKIQRRKRRIVSHSLVV